MGVISLWGLPGVGKSYWGKTWAEHLNLQFFDLDGLIEFKSKETVQGIFENYGEEYFRKLESEVLNQFLSVERSCILALGGGTPISDYNKQMLLDHSISVFMNANLKSIRENLLKETSTRPLFRYKEIDSVLIELNKKRLPHYQQASFTIQHPFRITSLNEVLKSISQP